jgi:hypothetical protein
MSSNLCLCKPEIEAGGDKKRKIKHIVIGIIIGGLIFGGIPTLAETGLKTIQATYDNIKITVDGEEVKMDVEPFSYQNRTFVPVRFVSEALGAQVNWNSETKTVEIIKNKDNLIDDAWKQTTSSLLSRTDNILKQNDKLDVSEYREIIKLVKLMNPVRQDSEAYIPPKEKEQIYNLLKEYVKAVESKLNARARIGMYREFESYGEESYYSGYFKGNLPIETMLLRKGLLLVRIIHN